MTLRKVAEKALLNDQLFVGAALYYPSLIEYKDLIGVDDGTEPVGDHDAGGIQLLEASTNDGLRLVIERACGLVEEENARAVNDGAGDEKAVAAGRPIVPRRLR